MKRETDLPLAQWVGGLPSDWDVTRQGNVAEILFSNVDKHTFDEEISVLLCNYTDAYYNDRITSKIEFMEASAEEREIKKFQLLKDDVLITKDSETPDDIAISAVVAEELPGVLCGYHLALVRPYSHKILGGYLAWVHASKQFRAQYEANAVGVTRFGLSQHIFKEVIVPLPPLPEQERIVAFLDSSCAAIDTAVQAKRDQIDVLKKLRTDTIKHVTTQGLNPDVEQKPSGLDWLSQVPSHWKVKQIKRQCELLRGKFTHRPRNDPAFYGGEYPFVQTGDITSAEKYITSYSQTLNELGFSVSKMFPKGTLVMSIAANVGDVAILDFEACFPDSMVGLVPYHDTDLDYLFYLMQGMKEILLRSAVITTQLNLNYVRIGTNFAAFPPKDEQIKIAKYLDKRVREIKEVVTTLNQQIDTLLEYRNSLIH